MALIGTKVIKAVSLEKSVGQVRVVGENVVLQDDVEIYRGVGNEVYTQETAQELRDNVPDGSIYANLMGW